MREDQFWVPEPRGMNVIVWEEGDSCTSSSPARTALQHDVGYGSQPLVIRSESIYRDGCTAPSCLRALTDLKVD